METTKKIVCMCCNALFVNTVDNFIPICTFCKVQIKEYRVVFSTVCKGSIPTLCSKTESFVENPDAPIRVALPVSEPKKCIKAEVPVKSPTHTYGKKKSKIVYKKACDLSIDKSDIDKSNCNKFLLGKR